MEVTAGLMVIEVILVAGAALHYKGGYPHT